VFYYIVPYRKKVVSTNVKNSFPSKSGIEQKLIVKNFYKYFSRLLAESIKNLSINQSQLKKRMVVKNPEVMDELYDQGKNVILLSSHYNNWELLITSQNLLFKHQAVGIGMPLTNKFWDKKINTQRERFGMKVTHAKNYKDVLNNCNEPTATLVLGDQNPSNPNNSFWTEFLNQKTAFFFGAEIMANQRNSAVVNAHINLVKKGYYEIELDLITENPTTENYGHITSNYIKNLEQSITKKPEFWLWSHKRWKMNVPENVEKLQMEHKERFEQKFR
jgi:KDO2-lipid IV(A) lauroyltransferase